MDGDPFKKYGGQQIDDPFKKYGGTSIEEPVKKKETGGYPLAYPGKKGQSFVSLKSKPSGETPLTFEERKSILDKSVGKSFKTFTDEDAQNEALADIQKGAADGNQDDPLGNALLHVNKTKYSTLDNEPENKLQLKVFTEKLKLLNNVFSTAKEAQDYLESNAKELGGNINSVPEDKLSEVAGQNITKQYAVNKYNKYKTAESAMYNIVPSGNMVQGPIKVKKDFDQAAIDYAIKSGNKDVAYLMEKGGGSPNAIPESMKGDLALKLIHSPEIAELAEHDPELKKDIQTQLYNFPTKHPETAVRILAEMIANKREEKGINTWYGNLPGKESTDKIVQEMIDDGDLPANYKFVYEKELRPKLGTWRGVGRLLGNTIPILNKAVNEAPIPTPGLTENIIKGAEDVETGLAKTVAQLTPVIPGIGGGMNVADLLESKPQELRRTLTKASETPSFEPKSLLHQASMHGGQMIPMIASLLGGSEVLQATRLIKSPEIASAVSMMLNTHGETVEKANSLFPGETGKQLVYTNVMDILNGVMGKYLPGQNLLKGQTVVKDIVKAMADGEIAPDVAKNRIVKWLGDAAKGTVGGGEFMGALAATDNLLTQTLQGHGVDFSEALDKGWEGFKTGLIASSVVAGMAAFKQNPGIKNEVYNFAAHPEESKQFIEEQAAKDPEFAKVKDDILNNIDYVSGVHDYLKNYPELTEQQKIDFVTNSLLSKVKREKAAQVPDANITRRTQEEVRGLDEENERILKGEKTEEKPSEEVSKPVELNPELPEGYKLPEQPSTELEVNLPPSHVPKSEDVSVEGKSDTDIEKRMAEIEGNPSHKDEFNTLEKEMEQRERASVFNVPLSKANEAIDALMKKEKEMPNGFGSFLESQDAKESKRVIDRYQNWDKLSDKDVKKDFKDALLGNPDTWYADGLKLRESMNQAAVRKIDIETLLSEVEKEFISDGYTSEQAKQVIAGRLAKIYKGSEKVETDQSKLIEQTPNIKQQGGEGEATKTTEIPLETKAQGAEPPKTTEAVGAAEEKLPSQIGPGEVKEAKGALGEGETVGITHADMDKIAKELGLAEYEKDPQTEEQWIADADKRLQKPGEMDALLTKMEKNKNYQPDGVENKMAIRYIASLKSRIESNPSTELVDALDRAKEAFNMAGRAWGISGRSRQGYVPVEDTLGDFLLSRKKDKGRPLSEDQVKSETKKYNELKAAKEKLEVQLESEREQYTRMAAEYGVNKAKAAAKKAAKKSHEDYVAERKSAVEGAKEALRKLRGEATATAIPGVRELAAIAPHVKKYAETLIAEGVDKLDNLITDIHAEFKDALEGLKKSDVMNILAGEHDEKGQTKVQKASELRLVQREAALLKELQDARKGIEKEKSEKKKNEKTDRIKALEEKIKQVRELNKEKYPDEAPEDKTVAEGQYNDRRQKALLKKAEKLSADLKNKKYEPEPKKEPKYQKTYKTQQLEDAVINLEKQLQHERVKDRMSKRSKPQKVFDFVTREILGVKRLLQTILDWSIFLRQTGRLGFNPRKWDVFGKEVAKSWASTWSQKKFDRYMNEIHKDPEFQEMVEDGIKYNEFETNEIAKENEFYYKNWIFRVPYLRQIPLSSQRAADAALNIARYEMYKKYKKNLMDNGITRESDPDVYKSMAGEVMNQTGSGKLLGMFENQNAQKFLGNTFYGAKLMASTFNQLNPYYYAKMPKEVRAMIWKDIASYVTTVFATGAAMAAAGGKVSFNPDDSDFLQVRFKDKVYDLTSGKAQYIRTALRILNSSISTVRSSFGDVSKSSRNKQQQSALESTFRFFRNKLAPNTGLAANYLFPQKEFGGREANLKQLTEFYPMYADDAIKGFRDEGLLSIATILAPNLLGVGYNQYFSGINEQPVENTLDRNLTSDEMNLDSYKNYREGGRELNDKEKKEFAEKRDAEIEKSIREFYDKGRLVLEDGNVVRRKFSEMKDQKKTKEEIAAIKASVTKKLKEEMFWKEKKTRDELRAEAKLEKEKRKEKQNQ